MQMSFYMLLTVLLFLPLICYYYSLYSNYSQITDFEMDRTYQQPTTIFFEHNDHYLLYKALLR